MGAEVFVAAEAEAGEFVMRLPAVAAHTLWAPVYDSSPNPLLALERRVVAALLKGRATGTVVDVGCGTGQWLEQLQQAGARVFGLDACEAMLREASKRDAISDRLVQADAHLLPFATGRANLILCSMSLGYFQDLDVIFREFARVAHRRASIVISDMHPDAIEAGWKRSFRSGAIRCDVEHFQRSVEQILHAASRAGLRLRWCAEACLGEPEIEMVREAGKSHLVRELARTPALLLAIWEK